MLNYFQAPSIVFKVTSEKQSKIRENHHKSKQNMIREFVTKKMFNEVYEFKGL